MPGQKGLARHALGCGRPQQKSVRQKGCAGFTHAQDAAAKGHGVLTDRLHQQASMSALPAPQLPQIEGIAQARTADGNDGQVELQGAAMQAGTLKANQHGGKIAAVAHAAGQRKGVFLFHAGRAHGRTKLGPARLFFRCGGAGRGVLQGYEQNTHQKGVPCCSRWSSRAVCSHWATGPGLPRHAP